MGRRRRASTLSRLAAWAGIAGPLLFTAAWVVSSLRQAGHPAAGVQLSGLAAADARDPQIMIAAFVVLGACSIGFGAALRKVAPGSAGPWLVMVAGAAAGAVGVFRRDHMLLTGPGFAGESWHNQVHDVASGIAYVAMLAAPLVLVRRFRADSDWAVVCARFRFSRWPAPWPLPFSPPGSPSPGTASCNGPPSHLLLRLKLLLLPGC